MDFNQQKASNVKKRKSLTSLVVHDRVKPSDLPAATCKVDKSGVFVVDIKAQRRRIPFTHMFDSHESSSALQAETAVPFVENLFEGKDVTIISNASFGGLKWNLGSAVSQVLRSGQPSGAKPDGQGLFMTLATHLFDVLDARRLEPMPPSLAYPDNNGSTATLPSIQTLPLQPQKIKFAAYEIFSDTVYDLSTGATITFFDRERGNVSTPRDRPSFPGLLHREVGSVTELQDQVHLAVSHLHAVKSRLRSNFVLRLALHSRYTGENELGHTGLEDREGSLSVLEAAMEKHRTMVTYLELVVLADNRPVMTNIPGVRPELSEAGAAAARPENSLPRYQKVINGSIRALAQMSEAGPSSGLPWRSFKLTRLLRCAFTQPASAHSVLLFVHCFKPATAEDLLQLEPLFDVAVNLTALQAKAARGGTSAPIIRRRASLTPTAKQPGSLLTPGVPSGKRDGIDDGHESGEVPDTLTPTVGISLVRRTPSQKGKNRDGVIKGLTRRLEAEQKLRADETRELRKSLKKQQDGRLSMEGKCKTLQLQLDARNRELARLKRDYDSIQDEAGKKVEALEVVSSQRLRSIQSKMEEKDARYRAQSNELSLLKKRVSELLEARRLEVAEEEVAKRERQKQQIEHEKRVASGSLVGENELRMLHQLRRMIVESGEGLEEIRGSVRTTASEQAGLTAVHSALSVSVSRSVERMNLLLASVDASVRSRLGSTINSLLGNLYDAVLKLNTATTANESSGADDAGEGSLAVVLLEVEALSRLADVGATLLEKTLE